MPQPGWYRDPNQRHEHRWWDGSSWTSFVGDRGITAVDPLVAVRAADSARPTRPSRSNLLALAVVAVLVAAVVFVSQRHDNWAVLPGTAGPGSLPITSGEPLTPGPITPATDAVVGPAGGSVVVPASGTPVDGLEVVVPEGTFTADQPVSVSWATLTGTDPTGLVTPLSPLIRIEDGGAYGGDVIEVTVPATTPQGWVAMGFYRDPADGSLEGMPLLRADAASVTVGARHFSEFFIAGVADALLGSDISTGFDPSVDSWQFPNVGTSVVPGGHCAGMSLTAMWFFLEQKPACGCSLRGRYDNDQAFVVGPDTPDLWVDDARGLRWATTVQKDVRWKGSQAYESAWHAMYEVQSAIQLGAFRFSMAVTHEPQFVLLSTATGTPAHAMIAYGVSGDQLIISDPNTPNKNPDHITFDPATAAFAPFVSGVTADGPTITFDRIGYAAKSALFEWSSIGARFAEAEAGTVGMDRFTPFDLMAVELDADDREVHNLLTAGYVPQRNPLPAYAISLGRTLKVRATFFPGTSSTPGPVAEISTVAESAMPTTGTYAQLDAATVGSFGVLIEEWVVVGSDAAGNPAYEWRWADFQRFGFGAAPPPSTVAPTVAPPVSTVDCNQPPPGEPASKLNQVYMNWWLQCHDINDPFP